VKPVIPFFTDQNVPDSTGKALLSAGHALTRLRDVMLTTSPDPIVAIACAENSQVLVSHDNDFKAVAKRLQMSQRQYRRLHRVDLRCFEPEGAQRMLDAMSLIEHEWQVAQARGTAMVIEIRSTSIWIKR
jgi:predicted nuclease of predicted toxin-antitoxin system